MNAPPAILSRLLKALGRLRTKKWAKVAGGSVFITLLLSITSFVLAPAWDDLWDRLFNSTAETQLLLIADPETGRLFPHVYDSTTQEQPPTYAEDALNLIKLSQQADLYKQLISQERKSGSIDTEKLARLYLLWGSLLTALNVEQSAEAVETATALNPDAIDAWATLFHIRLGQGRISDARNALERLRALAETQNNDHGRMLITIADSVLAFAEGRYPDAVAGLKKAAEIAEQLGYQRQAAQLRMSSIGLSIIRAPLKDVRRVVANLLADCGAFETGADRAQCYELLANAQNRMRIAPELILRTSERALEELQKIGAKTSALRTRFNMAWEIQESDGWEAAERWLIEVRDEAQQRGLISIEAMALQSLSGLANVYHQDPKRALELGNEALDRIGTKWPDRSYRGDLLRWNAHLALRVGQPEIARKHFNEALIIAVELEQRVKQVEILLSLEGLSSSGDQVSASSEKRASVATLLDTILADPHGATELLELGMVLYRFPARLTDARRAMLQARLVANEENLLAAEFEAVLQLSMIGVGAFLDSRALGDEKEATENVDEALHYARQAKQLADRIDHPSFLAKSLFQLGAAAKFAGEVVTEQKAFEELAVIQTKGGEYSGEASLYLLEIAVRRGEIEDVDRYVESVKHYLHDSIPAYSITHALRALVEAYLFKDDGESAYAYAKKLLDARVRFPHRGILGHDEILFAGAAMAVGKYDEASTAVKTARAHYNQLGRPCEICDIFDRAIESKINSQMNKDNRP